MQKAMEVGYTASEEASIIPWVEALSMLKNPKIYFTKPEKEPKAK